MSEFLEALADDDHRRVQNLLDDAPDLLERDPDLLDAWLRRAHAPRINREIVWRVCAASNELIATCIDRAIRYNNCDVVYAFVKQLIAVDTEIDLLPSFELACLSERTAIVMLMIHTVTRTHAARLGLFGDLCAAAVLHAGMYDAAFGLVRQGVDASIVFEALVDENLQRPDDICFAERLLTSHRVTRWPVWFRSDNATIVETYVDHECYDGEDCEPLLCTAARSVAFEMTKMLIARGAKNFDQALMYICVYEYRANDENHEARLRIADLLLRHGARIAGFWFHLVNTTCRQTAREIVETTRYVLLETSTSTDEREMSRDAARYCETHGYDRHDFNVTVKTKLIEQVLHAGLPRSRVAGLRNAARVFRKLDKQKAYAQNTLVVGLHVPRVIASLITQYLP